MSELLVYPGQALKVVDPGEGDDALILEGYGLVFTKPSVPDLSRVKDYFTPDTDYGVLSDTKSVTLPSFFDHGATKELGTERLGWVEAKLDDIGVFARHIVKRRKDYVRRVIEMLGKERLELGQSSGAVPRDVHREQKGGVNWVTSWPMWEISLTPEPAEPMTRAAVKSIATGLALPGDGLDLPPDWDATALAVKALTEEIAFTRAIREGRMATC